MRIADTCLSFVAASLIAWPLKPALGNESANCAALEAASQAWAAAFAARDADAKASLITDDFVILPPNAAPVRGREAALALWRQAESSNLLQISLVREEIIVDGNLAYTMGSYNESLPTGHVVKHGMFIDIWRRVGDGWRVHRHMYSNGSALQEKGIRPVPVQDQPVLDSPDPG